MLRKRCRHRPVQWLEHHSQTGSSSHQTSRERQAGLPRIPGGSTAKTIQGYEAVHMIRKGQVRWVAGDDLLQIQFIDSLFDLAA